MRYAVILFALVASAVLTSPLLVAAPPQEPTPLNRPVFDKRLGVWLTDADANAGALVSEVLRDAGGWRRFAPLREGDLLIEFNGERLRNVEQFIAFVREARPGQEVQISLLRAGERREVTMMLDAAEIGRAMAPFAEGPTREGAFLRMLPAGGAKRVGIDVRELTPQLAEYFGTRGGVLVASVRAWSPAGRAGLRAGDVITGVDGEVIRSGADLAKVLRRDLTGVDVRILIKRDRQTRTVEIAVPRHSP